MADYNNIITTGFSKYVSYLAKGNTSNIYFSIGLGNTAWDSNDLPIPPVSISSLINEVYRKKVNNNMIEYVNPATLELSDVPTSTLRIEVDIGSDEYYGIIREYGLFSVDATESLNSGTLISYCCHKKQSVPVDSKYHKYVYINT